MFSALKVQPLATARTILCFIAIQALISLQTLASDSPSHNIESCTTASEKNCSDNTQHTPTHAPLKHQAEKDWSHKRQAQVSAIFPDKQSQVGAHIRPEKVKFRSPKFLAKVDSTQVTLEWLKAEGAENYHLQVSKDAGFNNRSMYIVDEKSLKTTQYELKQLEPGVKYFWRVAAVNPQQESQFTKSTFTFSAFETSK